MTAKRSSSRPTKVLEPSLELPVIPQTKTERAVLTVSEITDLVKGTLESEFSDIWVEGEISNSKISQAGHAYFSLKDQDSVLTSVMFRPSLTKLKFELEDGLHVIVHGRISVYEARGQYQLIADTIEVAGLGALQQAFEQLKEKLTKEGLFDEAHKRPIPLLPQRIGIVTSPTGAAIRDILNILNRRYTNLEIVISPTLVQGPQAAPQIAEAIDNLNLLKNLDVIIVTRGGGSLEDLWPFNEEIVARAVYHSQIPVISAVGHEIDFTICDFVSDLRAPTPSAAAELVVQNKSELVSTLQNCIDSLTHTMESQVKDLRGQLDNLISSPIFTQPTKTLEAYSQRVDDFSDRLHRHITHELTICNNKVKNVITRLNVSSPRTKLTIWQDKLTNSEKRLNDSVAHQLTLFRQLLEARMSNLNALSPLAVLGRGYSITFQLPEKNIVRDTNQIKIGDKIEVRVKQGQMTAEVLQKEKTHDGNQETSKV